MKRDIKWLSQWIEEYESEVVEERKDELKGIVRAHSHGKQSAIKRIKQKIDQLDEPEVVENLLVSKQKVTEVPQEWFDVIERNKDMTLETILRIANPKREEEEMFVKTWLAYPYIKVEEEQKYVLLINITDKPSKTNYETYLNKRGIFHSMENESFNSEEFNWSEEEIKDLENGEILFEHFAVKVEELGE